MRPFKARRLAVLLILLVITACVIYYNLDLTIWILNMTFDAKFRSCEHHRRDTLSAGSRDPLFVTLRQHGRLANWMYSYASLVGIASRNKRVPYLLNFHSLNSIFQLTKVRNADVSCLLTVKEDLPAAYDPNLEHLPWGNISIDGYLQSWKYFEHIKYDIKKEFQFQPHILEQARRAFDLYTANHRGKPVISIHVRRSDMMIPSSTKLGFKEAPLEYILNAMDYMRKKFPGAVFLVISDDIWWCQKNMKATDIVFTQDHVASVHLALLTMCNHSIVTTGTFGWWGAWLAGGHTVYYNNYPEPGSVVDRQTKREDFYPPDWVALSKGTSCSVNLSSWFIAFVLVVLLLNPTAVSHV